MIAYAKKHYDRREGKILSQPLWQKPFGKAGPMLNCADLAVTVSDPSFKIKKFSSHSFSKEALQSISKVEIICLDPCCVSL